MDIFGQLLKAQQRTLVHIFKETILMNSRAIEAVLTPIEEDIDSDEFGNKRVWTCTAYIIKREIDDEIEGNKAIGIQSVKGKNRLVFEFHGKKWKVEAITDDGLDYVINLKATS